MTMNEIHGPSFTPQKNNSPATQNNVESEGELDFMNTLINQMLSQETNENKDKDKPSPQSPNLV